jgi:large subunit ribosomal protein L18
MALSSIDRRNRIRRRIRKVVQGTAQRPRLAVFRSNKAIYAQLIDDVTGTTLGSATSVTKKGKAFEGAKTNQAFEVGKAIAAVAQAKGISAVAFDSGGYFYHGRVKSLADGAREGGLNF